jgi:hypothetical protein
MLYKFSDSEYEPIDGYVRAKNASLKSPRLYFAGISVATALTLASTAATAYGAYQSGQAAKAGNGSPVNVSGAILDAQTQATNDLQNSLNLEQQYLPGQYANMLGAFNNTNNILAGNTQAQQAQSALLSQGSGVTNASTNAYLNNPLTTAANSSILQSLNMGGQLDPSTQAQVVQSALQQGGAAGISGSGAGRGLTARDLGLTSLQLLQSRQAQASTAGNAYGALGLQQQSLNLQNYLGQIGAANSVVGLQNQYALGTQQLANNLQLPNSGLTGSQVASLDVGNTNILNNNQAQNAAVNSKTINSLAGTFTGAGGFNGLAGLFTGSGGGSTYNPLTDSSNLAYLAAGGSTG